MDQNSRSCLKQPTEQSFIHSIDKLIGDRKNLKKSIHRASGALKYDEFLNGMYSFPEYDPRGQNLHHHNLSM